MTKSFFETDRQVFGPFLIIYSKYVHVYPNISNFTQTYPNTSKYIELSSGGPGPVPQHNLPPRLVLVHPLPQIAQPRPQQHQ